jgi:hypothetical protein
LGCDYDEQSVKDFFYHYLWIGLLCHELGHTLGKPHNYADNMGSYYQTMEENRAEIIAIKAWYDLVNE